MSNQQKLTRWFHGDVKPARVGYYQRDWNDLELTEWPDYWNGEEWFNGIISGHYHRPSCSQLRYWRGLADKPPTHGIEPEQGGNHG